MIRCLKCNGEIIYEPGIVMSREHFPEEWRCLKCGRRLSPKQVEALQMREEVSQQEDRIMQRAAIGNS